MPAPPESRASRWPALAMIGSGGTMILIGALAWVLFGQTILGAVLAAAGAALEATGVVKLLRTLKKN